MKKIIAVLLSIMMIFSCVVVSASAADETETTQGTIQNLIDKALAKVDFEEALSGFNTGSVVPSEYLDGSDTLDVDALLTSGLLNDIDMMGLSIDFLYNSTDQLMWTDLSVDKAYVTLAKANINTYLSTCLSKVMKGSYDSTKFCTAANATKITNFIGHLINPDFVDVNITSIYDTSVDKDTIFDNFNQANMFYGVIANLSGLVDVMQANWCDQPKVNYLPILYVLGFDFDDDSMLGSSKLTNAQRIAPVLIKSVLQNIEQYGPLEYILKLVSRVASTYSTCMYEPIKALLKANIVAGVITEQELSTLKGLCNLISNGNDKTNSNALQFISMPAYRFAACTKMTGSKETLYSTDTTEMFLYALVYCNLLGVHSTNKNVVAKMKTDVNNEPTLDSDQKSVVISIIDGMFTGDSTNFVSSMATMFDSNISAVGGNLWDTFVNFFKNYFATIANFFNKLFDSIANFGKF